MGYGACHLQVISSDSAELIRVQKAVGDWYELSSVNSSQTPTKQQSLSELLPLYGNFLTEIMDYISMVTDLPSISLNMALLVQDLGVIFKHAC